MQKELDNALGQLETPNEEYFKRQCEYFLPPYLASFIKTQLEMLKRGMHGKRYSNEYKQFALSLYFLSPKCYSFLRTVFCLPMYRSLCRYIEKTRFVPGINTSLFEFLKLKVAKMQPDKVCVLCVDEMTLKAHLFYNCSRDIVIGFEDDGVIRSNKIASSATVFMLRGIKTSWKQPIAYILSSTNYKAYDIKVILEQLLGVVREIGLEVICFISDMGSNCIELSKLLGVTPDKPHFNLGGNNIFYYFDPPHMLKAFRNNFMNFQYQWDNCSASWSHIVTFYEQDKMLNNRMAPKLTKSHIEPTNFEKMRVYLATQVISNTVGAALDTYIQVGALPPSAQATSDIICTFDKLFDLLNSSDLNAKKEYHKPFNGSKYQMEFLESTLKLIEQLKVYNLTTKKFVSVKFLNCFRITINSLINLWPVLQSKGYNFLLTRFLQGSIKIVSKITLALLGNNMEIVLTQHQFSLIEHLEKLL